MTQVFGMPVRQRLAFRTMMQARLDASPNGTRIRCYLYVHPLVLAVSSFWVAGLSTVLLIEPSAWEACLGMLAIFAMLVIIGRQGAMDDRQLFTEFLLATLKAHPTSER